nr:MAG TPA: hypothetical protein [Caudoviricetes sp.]
MAKPASKICPAIQPRAISPFKCARAPFKNVQTRRAAKLPAE